MQFPQKSVKEEKETRKRKRGKENEVERSREGTKRRSSLQKHHSNHSINIPYNNKFRNHSKMEEGKEQGSRRGRKRRAIRKEKLRYPFPIPLHSIQMKKNENIVGEKQIRKQWDLSAAFLDQILSRHRGMSRTDGLVLWNLTPQLVGSFYWALFNCRRSFNTFRLVRIPSSSPTLEKDLIRLMVPLES